MSSSADNIRINTDKRLFYISDDIDNESMGAINFNLLYLLQQDEEKDKKQKDFKREPIRIFINSNGGEVDDMWSLIDIILNSQTPIYTYCTGYAYSAGFLIFLAGSKRFLTKHARLLFHQMSCFRSGKYKDIVEDRKEMDYMQTEINNYVRERTKIDEGYLYNWIEKKQDRYFHPEEAIKLGIADKIIGKEDED